MSHANPTVEGWRLHLVELPLRVVYVSSMYVMQTTRRTIVELIASDGTVGLGETLGVDEVFDLTARLARTGPGTPVEDRRARLATLSRSVFDNRNGRNGWAAAAGIDIAGWDATARGLGRSLTALLGGAARDRVEVVCPLPAVVLDRPMPREALRQRFADLVGVEEIVRHALDERARFGFRCFKYKSAGVSPTWDLAVMTALREAMPDARLRFDPNADYPLSVALALAGRLDPLGLEFLEDPTDEREGLAAIRRRVRTPVATNMCVVQRDQIAPAVRTGAVDVVLGDVYLWGGITGFQECVDAADGLGIEVAIHSIFETGIGTALNAHLAAANPRITRANDSGYHLLGADLLVAPLTISDGHLCLPAGAGLGVALDPTRLRAHTRTTLEISA